MMPRSITIIIATIMLMMGSDVSLRLALERQRAGQLMARAWFCIHLTNAIDVCLNLLGR